MPLKIETQNRKNVGYMEGDPFTRENSLAIKGVAIIMMCGITASCREDLKNTRFVFGHWRRVKRLISLPFSKYALVYLHLYLDTDYSYHILAQIQMQHKRRPVGSERNWYAHYQITGLFWGYRGFSARL